MTAIHSTAIVAPGAQLDDSVTVGPYAVIDDGVEIGAGTKIGAHTVIRAGTSIGRDNHIFQFGSVGEAPQDKKYAGEASRLVIGDRNTIREFCTINRGTVQDEGVTSIGDDNWIMAYAHVAHDCRIGNGVILANNTSLAGHVHVHDFVIFSGFTGAHQFCKVGAHAFIGPYAGITRDVPPYMMIAGQPPEPRGINLEGLKRRGFDAASLRNLREAYRILYRSGLRLVEAQERLAALLPEQPELGILVDFLAASERSIVR